MNKKRKLISGSIVGLMGLIGMGTISSSYAFEDHYHHHYYPHQHYYHGRDNLAVGLLFGTAFGMMAGAAIHRPVYYGSCQRIYYDRYCRYDMWGDQSCYVERRVEYVC